MPTTIEEFDAVRITNFNIKFKGEQTAQSFGCVGQLEGETEMITIVKKCEGVETKSKSKPQKMTLSLNAHVKVAPLRSIFGLSNEGLKPGVYSYGSNSKSKDFVLTADVIDEFEDLTKLIAFPNCTSSTGLTLSIENGADEVAELELEFTAMVDDNKNCYYEALLDELADTTVAETWRTNFTPDLVKEVPAP
ncbi:phage tail protein [Heyndrickxia sporothermodurans]|uniref:phage tail protein n=1 Tax=Heyndrickxia sporothermodurans TaxID=46224 RepID=UPI000D3DB530|nr:phage tail protein [Heyndrickxia sporothermodurans]PTY77352.1 phage tail protein [Heyndrickxia sporothermodurans]